jgi:hypothetical protein
LRQMRDGLPGGSVKVRAHKPAPLSAPRILIADVETNPITAHVWGVRDQYVGLDQVIEDWSVLAFAAKWYGDKKVSYTDTSGRGAGKVRDDKALLAELASLLDEADIVVGHTAKAFALKKISARMIQHGMKPHSPVRCIDTYHAAKRAGAFSSNKLANPGFLVEIEVTAVRP